MITSNVMMRPGCVCMMYKHSKPPGYCSGYPGDVNTCPWGVARKVPPQFCGSVFQDAL